MCSASLAYSCRHMVARDKVLDRIDIGLYDVIKSIGRGTSSSMAQFIQCIQWRRRLQCGSSSSSSSNCGSVTWRLFSTRSQQLRVYERPTWPAQKRGVVLKRFVALFIASRFTSVTTCFDWSARYCCCCCCISLNVRIARRGWARFIQNGTRWQEQSLVGSRVFHAKPTITRQLLSHLAPFTVFTIFIYLIL